MNTSRRRQGVLAAALLLACSAASPARSGPIDTGYADVDFGTGGLLNTNAAYGTAAGAGKSAGVLGDGGVLYVSSPFSWSGGTQFQRTDSNGRTLGPPSALTAALVSSYTTPMLRTPDGKLLIGSAGADRGAIVVRLDASGNLDATFGFGGALKLPGCLGKFYGRAHARRD